MFSGTHGGPTLREEKKLLNLKDGTILNIRKRAIDPSADRGTNEERTLPRRCHPAPANELSVRDVLAFV